MNYSQIQWKDTVGWVNNTYISCQKTSERSNDPKGDFALSTYDWNWKPYWLAFKEKLDSVWYAPPAYFMGVIHGHTILRFKVYPNGDIADLEVLSHVGHEVLEECSYGAIQVVFPFEALPDDFTEEYLEVTLKLIYPNLKEYQPE
jgi:hypothetical protein